MEKRYRAHGAAQTLYEMVYNRYPRNNTACFYRTKRAAQYVRAYYDNEMYVNDDNSYFFFRLHFYNLHLQDISYMIATNNC
jgi:hypothetical protein